MSVTCIRAHRQGDALLLHFFPTHGACVLMRHQDCISRHHSKEQTRFIHVVDIVDIIGIDSMFQCAKLFQQQRIISIKFATFTMQIDGA